MSQQDSTVEDPTEPVTTSAVEIIQQTATGSSMTSSTSCGVDFYFQCAVVAIGIVGTAANALIIYAMVASREHKKHVLIFNQNALDFISCFCLVVTYALKLCNIRLTGRSGYWLCMTLLSENFVWCPTVGSTINLAAITVERYLKIVHSTWSKKRLRNWMIYSASAFAWVGGTVVSNGVTIPTTNVLDGVCYPGSTWESNTAYLAYRIWYFLSFEVIILAIFIFCYWRILAVVRRQASVMASHDDTEVGPSTTQANYLNQMQSNVIKTMSIVTVFFVVSWTPVNVYLFLVITNASKIRFVQGTYYAVLFIAFLYICTNPFIYAVKFDPVKHVLIGLIPCRKNPVQPVENIEVT